MLERIKKRNDRKKRTERRERKGIFSEKLTWEGGRKRCVGRQTGITFFSWYGDFFL